MENLIFLNQKNNHLNLYYYGETKWKSSRDEKI